MKQIIGSLFLIGCIVWLGGCSTVRHVDELLVLKKVSDSQDAMAEEIKSSDERFALLVDAIERNYLSKEDTQKSIVKLYGEPVLKERQLIEGQSLDVWLYRRATRFFDTSKVYLFFNKSRKLSQWKYVKVTEVQDGEIRKKTTTETAGP